MDESLVGTFLQWRVLDLYWIEFNLFLYSLWNDMIAPPPTHQCSYGAPLLYHKIIHPLISILVLTSPDYPWAVDLDIQGGDGG